MPLCQPPIENGALLIKRNRIAAVAPWSKVPAELRRRAVDLGDTLLLPGLINSHCHLDYTNMAGQFSPPKIFTDWLKLITTAKAGWSYSDYADSWIHGAKMLVRTGTTTVGDIEAVPEMLPEVWSATPLRVISYLEMIGITSRRQPRDLLEEATDQITSLGDSRCRAGLSPHAPYSTLPELLRLTAKKANRRRLPLCIHVAESALEFEMFRHGRGEMFNWFQRSGRDCSDCKLGSPVQHLERNGALSERLLAVHANYLGPKDATLLAKRGVSVAHCPRSHSYFRHGAFPLRRLLKAGVNVCLGTDSLASVVKNRRQTVELNMFEEMRTFADNHPWISPKRILHMTTINAARALGMPGTIGELKTGAFADVIGIPFTGNLSDAFDIILNHSGQVSASVIDGKWAVAPAN